MPPLLSSRRDVLKAALPFTAGVLLPARAVAADPLALAAPPAADADSAGAVGSAAVGSGARPTVPVTGADGIARGVDIVVVGAGTVHAARHGLGRPGVDARTAFESAVAEAREQKAALVLPSGEFRLRAGAGIDLTGVRAVEGNARLEFADAPVTGALFASGAYRPVASRTVLRRGQDRLTVARGLSLRPGQTLLVFSGEPTPYAARSYYGRGERAYVADYNASDGTLVLMSPLLYDYRAGTASVSFSDTGERPARVMFSGATLWAVDEQALSFGHGLTFAGPATAGAAGFAGRLLHLQSAAAFENFGYLGLGLWASTGRIEGRIVAGYHRGSGDSYGVGVMDLSRITISADVVGGRHAVASGGGGWLSRSHAASTINGGAGGLSLPSVLHIVGGEYRATSQNPMGALDAHGGVEELIVTGATVYEGIQASARRNRIVGCTVYHQKMAGVYMTGHAPASGASPYAPDGEWWGDLEVSSTTFETVGAALLPAVQVMNGLYRTVVLRDVRVRGRWEAAPGSSAETYRRPVFVGEDALCRIRHLDLDVQVFAEYDGDPSQAGAAQPLPSRVFASHPAHVRWRGTGALAVLATSGPARAATDAGSAHGVDVDLDVDIDLDGYARAVPGLEVRGGVVDVQPRHVRLHGRVLNGPTTGATVTAQRVDVERGEFSGNGRHAQSAPAQRAGLSVTAGQALLARIRCGDRSSTQNAGFYFGALGATGVLDLVDVDLSGCTAPNARGFGLTGAGVRLRGVERSVQGDGRPIPNQWSP